MKKIDEISEEEGDLMKEDDLIEKAIDRLLRQIDE